MTKLLEIERCCECRYYRVRGDLFHTHKIEDSVGNVVHLDFDEYIGYCDKSNRIKFEEGIPLWCELEDA